MLVLLFWVAVLLIAAVIYMRRAFSSFERHGIKNLKTVPVFGNMANVMLKKNHVATDLLELYRTFPEERFVGRYEFFKEMIVIRDLDLVKKITVKDFEHFIDHRSMFEHNDSYFSRGLISLKGQEWKDMRSTISPVFTSSKIRLMVPFMVEVGDQMMLDLKQQINSNNGQLDVDCRDLTTRYATDVIATCVFGLKVNSRIDKTNEFYVTAHETADVNFTKILRMFFLINMPKVARVFDLDLMTKQAKNFYKHLVLGTMKDREEKNIYRPDMIHMLMEAKKGKLKHENVNSVDKTAGFATAEESTIGTKQVNKAWSDNDLIAQAVIFFIAGFDTVSTAMSFLLYELALNPEVQEKLAQEIKEHDAKNGGKFDLNSIQSMTYMDMVISELLRKWPAALILDRVCKKDYNLGRPNKTATKDYIVRQGASVMIPMYALHHDPQYFPNPEKFDPERFSAENQHKINPYAYMPFGVGPRNCIGSRFALCEVKVMIYQVLRHIEVSPCEKTCIPAELVTDSFNIRLKGGHWLKFKERT